MSAPSPPPDNSLAVQQEQDKAAAAKQAADKQAADEHATMLSGLRTSARTGAESDAENFFTGRGLDPSQYQSQIDSQINNIASGISPTDENPGSYFKDAGQNIYNNLTSGYQAKEQSAIDREFAPNFETQRIPFTLDQPYIAGIDAEQRGNADAIIKNMLDRGVITPTGYGAAQADLDRQEAGVKTKLNEFGTSTIASGQQQLKAVADNARTTAGTLKLGDQFDPNTYGAQADQVFNDFINNLGNTIRSKVTGNLFNTTGLAALAGAAQGAGNTAFNPAAAAGIINSDPNNNQSTGANTPSTKESIF